MGLQECAPKIVSVMELFCLSCDSRLISTHEGFKKKKKKTAVK